MSESEINLFDEQQFKSADKKFKLRATKDDGDLIKSKDRVQHHGEVFTPKWMVKKCYPSHLFKKSYTIYMLLSLSQVLVKGHF